MNIKKMIAKKLYPEAFIDSEKLWWLRSQLEQDRRWLGEFPEINAYLDHTIWNFADRYKTADQPAIYRKWRWDVSDFRDQLRDGRHLKEDTK